MDSWEQVLWAVLWPVLRVVVATAEQAAEVAEAVLPRRWCLQDIDNHMAEPNDGWGGMDVFLLALGERR